MEGGVEVLGREPASMRLMLLFGVSRLVGLARVEFERADRHSTMVHGACVIAIAGELRS